MAHGLNSVVIKRNPNTLSAMKSDGKVGGIGSRRIFAPQFKLQVLDSYRNDADCKGNQRATARKYGIHRRQIQKWLQVETNLRNSVMKMKQQSNGLVIQPTPVQQVSISNSEMNKKCVSDLALSNHRQRDDTSPTAYSQHPLNVITAPTEQRVPYIPTAQHTSPVVYTQLSNSVNSTHDNNIVVLTPVCISPEVHLVPTSTVSPPASTPHLSSSADVKSPPHLPTTNNNNIITESALDFTTHALSHIHHHPQQERELIVDYNSCDDSCMYEVTSTSPYPIDLSLKKSPSCCSCSPLLYCPPQPPLQSVHSSEPIITYDSSIIIQQQPSPIYNNNTSSTYYVSSLCSPVDTQYHQSLRSNTEYEIWDLSIKNKENLKRKSYHNLDNPTVDSPPLKKPVKLFKPYLDDDDYCCSSTSSNSSETRSKSDQFDAFKKEEPYYVQDYPKYINNNNEVYKIGLETHQSPYYYNSYVTKYENDPYYVESSHAIYETDPYVVIESDEYPEISSTSKQRQSYSVNFKLSAIECYYKDEICRGNQRAVASKYKVHRRQVQKWLQQEQELRDRIQSASEIIVS